MRYICRTSCIYNGKIYYVGQELETKAKNVPEHFEPVKELKNTTPPSDEKPVGPPNI